MGATRGGRGWFRFLACTVALLPAILMGLSTAGETRRTERSREFRKRPQPEFVADGVEVYRLLPPDAIAAIDEPEMIPAAEVAGIMSDDEPVLGVSDGAIARAWSIWMLDAHEVVNDRLGDTPIAATWCPLANTGVVFERIVDGAETTFGVTGALWRDSLVLFDRKTLTYWSQVAGLAIHGARRGAALVEIPSVTTTWGAWKTLHPETLVLRPDLSSRDGSPFAQYSKDPGRFGLTRTIKPDRRLPGKKLVLGVKDGEAATAIPLETLADRLVVQEQMGQTPVAIVSVARRGGFGYDRRVTSGTLDFEVDPQGGLRDRQTGSTWDPESGRAIGGALAGERLRRLTSRSAFWFTWASFHPATGVAGQHDLLVKGEPSAR